MDYDTEDLEEGMVGTYTVENTNQYMADTSEGMGKNATMSNNKTLTKKGESMAVSDYATGDTVAMDTVNLDVDMAGTGTEEDTGKDMADMEESMEEATTIIHKFDFDGKKNLIIWKKV